MHLGFQSNNLLTFLLSLALCFNYVCITTSQSISPKFSSENPAGNLTDLVKWDGYSLLVQNQRIFLWSGEFHPWRLPVVELWPDILQKMKAAGMNAVSIYVHWYESPTYHVIPSITHQLTVYKGAFQSFSWCF